MLGRLRILTAFLLGSLLLLARAETPSEIRDNSPHPTLASGELPQTVDLRPTLQNWGLGPRQQGARGTCSAFTLAGALEFAVARQQGQGTRLSVEFLNWAANKVSAQAEDGGFFSELWDGFAAYGICPEEDLPYRAKFDPAIEPDVKTLTEAKSRLKLGLQLHWIKTWNVQTGLTPAHFGEIKRRLSQGWPVCGGLRWPKQEQWDQDVLRMCPPNAVRDGHSVLLVGYRDESGQPGGGVFLFRNTSREGRDGCMPYQYAQTYMNDAVWIDLENDADKSIPSRLLHPVFCDPLEALAVLPTGRNRRISSNEQPKWNDSNLDMTMLPPGKVLELPVLHGPGMITHLWFTSHAGWANELNALSLRIYWDDRPEPGVEVPLGEFFAVGQGKPAVVESLPVQVSPSGALTCYWRMPFARSARIVIVNDNPNRAAGLYWQVDWLELADLPPNTPYFHARYRQEYPAVSGRDYLIADIRGRGQYIGTVLSVTLGQDGWWGEGDDFFYIDGESSPSLQGTGSEDYFNDAWGFRPRASHWFGQPRWQGDNAGDSGVCYRWHVLDPVHFTNSLRLTLEHKGNRADDVEGFYLERPDFINTVAFWYQVGEPTAFGHLPSYPQRRVPWEHHHLVRAFRQAQVTGPAAVQVQTTGLFGARPVLGWPNTESGARLTLPFGVELAGHYAMRLTAVGAPDHGLYDIELDGKPVLRSVDFRTRDFEELDLLLDTPELAPGQHTVSFRALETVGGRARPMAVEMLRLLRLPPEANRAIKTHNEAHFVRLGIGRAVYAFRLAYDKLPDSLDALVKAGLMSARYLADENGKPLLSRREGDCLVVESPGPGGWKHRWQGLDARR